MVLDKRLLTSVAAGILIAASGTAGAVTTKFEDDIAASIDKGLDWFATSPECFGGANGTTFNCDDATGLALLALLEKRPTANGAPQGYDGASSTDQARMRRTVRHIIDSIAAQTSFYSYRDGGYMMALSVYMRSGGPDKDDGPTSELDGAPLTLKQALDKAFDRTIANQRKGLTDATAPHPENNGYWCYNNNSCRDSSTTQLVIAGLAAARGAYISGDYADAVRAKQLDDATLLARKAYERNGTAGGNCTADPQPVNEKGHGYNAGYTVANGNYYANSSQQTASGLWIQLVGGAGLNWPSVQGYLHWLQNRYRYSDITTGGVGTTSYFADYSYGYYLWSSFKAYQFLVDSKAVPSAGNIGVADIGTLPAASAPSCTARQVHLDPDVLPQVPLFGSGAAGYYGDETPRIYFDYAYSIMSDQCGTGQFRCAEGTWDEYAEQAYNLLVLQRSVGGGCLDVDRDGICDSDDPDVIQPPVPPPNGGLYCDRPNDADTKIDAYDLSALYDLYKGRGSVPVTPSNAWANYRNDSVINSSDWDDCKYVFGNRLPKKYY